MNVVLGKAGLNSNSTDLWKEALQLSKRRDFIGGPLHAERHLTIDRSFQHMSLSKYVESR